MALRLTDSVAGAIVRQAQFVGPIQAEAAAVAPATRGLLVNAFTAAKILPGRGGATEGTAALPVAPAPAGSLSPSPANGSKSPAQAAVMAAFPAGAAEPGSKVRFSPFRVNIWTKGVDPPLETAERADVPVGRYILTFRTGSDYARYFETNEPFALPMEGKKAFMEKSRYYPERGEFVAQVRLDTNPAWLLWLGRAVAGTVIGWFGIEALEKVDKVVVDTGNVFPQVAIGASILLLVWWLTTQRGKAA